MAEKIARMPAESMRFRQSYADEGKGGISSERGRHLLHHFGADRHTPERERENFKATFGWAREIFSRCAPKSTTASELLSLKTEQRCESCLSLFAPCVVYSLATHSRYARIIGEDSLVLALCCRSQVDAQCRSADEMPYTEEVYTAEE